MKISNFGLKDLLFYGDEIEKRTMSIEPLSKQLIDPGPGHISKSLLVESPQLPVELHIRADS